MPGTTRYSATFDRTYEEDDRLGPPPPANTRRSRSQSWQAHSGLDGRPYTPLGSRPPAQRSSSTDSGASKVPDHIPTRTVAKTAVKAHNNPFQFVKVGTCPLYKKAEEQLKKTKEEKKQDVFKEEEEEWQSNLDSWKSRRRKMSEDVFRRQEEIKQFELEEQVAQVSQKKTKTFSEMVESRAHRGRTLSLCLISNPLEFQDWEYENKGNTNGSCSTFTDESEENSTVNSEDEGVSLRGRQGRPTHHDNQKGFRTNGEAHIEQNGSKLETHNSDFNNVQKPKEGSYIDSGLESISSSHRAGDTPDSGSDFSQDSNSSIDCESPRTGVNILEEFNSKSLQMSSGRELSVKLSLTDKALGFGFQFQGGKDAGQVLIKSVIKASRAELSGVLVGDQIIAVEGTDVSSKTHSEITTMVQKGVEKGEISLLLWRHNKTTNGFNVEDKHVGNPVKPNKDSQNTKLESQQYEKSIESENEMYVDDFEELQRQSELLTSNKKSEANCTNSQAQSNGNTSPTILSSDKDSIKSSSALKLTENISNGAVDKQNKNEKTDSEISPESPKKNIVKVKRVRRKGVYALDVSGIPNEIPQEGIPVGSLYPLSPVTELPSPADETKTLSSTLSSNPTTPVSNSLKNILLEKAVKETEAKLNSCTIKENNKTTASPKSVTSRTTVSSDELKISTPDKVESKTDSASVPTSPTVAKKKENISLESSLEDKPKIPSSPKKVKVKVKKANSESEQKSSESSPIDKEALSSSVTQISDLSIKKLAPESQPKREQRSDSVTDGKTIKINKNENLESSSKRENNISLSETAAVQSDAISSSLKDKTSSIKGETSCATTRNLSLKIGASKEYDNLATTPPATSAKPPKTPVDEKSKPPYAPKKEKTKPKENNGGSTPVISEAKPLSSKSKIAVINNDASADKTKNMSLKTETQNESVHMAATSPVTNSVLPQTPQEEKTKPSFAQKKEKTKSKENNNPTTETAIQIQEAKFNNLKDKTATIDSGTSSDKIRNLSLNIHIQNQTINSATMPPVSNAKQPKTPQGDKSKPPFTQKKEKILSKDNTADLVSHISSQDAKETFTISVTTCSSPAVNLTKESPLAKELNSVSGEMKKVSNAKGSTESSEIMENNVLPSETSTAVTEAKSSSTKEISVSSDETRNLSLQVDALKDISLDETSPVANIKQPITPQDEKTKPRLVQKRSKSKENNVLSSETVTVSTATKSSGLKEKSISSDKTRNLTLHVDAQKETASFDVTSPVANSTQSKTPQEEKTNQLCEERSKPKDNNAPSAEIAAGFPVMKSTASKDKISVANIVTDSDRTRNLTLNNETQNQYMNISVIPPVVNAKMPKTPTDEKSKPSLAQKKENTKPKNTNSQKVNSPAKQNEEVMNLNIDSLNVIFQSEPKNKLSENQSVIDKNSENNSNKKAATDLVPDIPPVEKVAEEMEKLILEQLEEEERAKELASQTKNAVGSPEHLLIAPPRLAEPPKEKPPPPPSASEGSQKDSSLKRVNSTKRIKKEIHKRRSNFLGIDNVDESIVCSEPSIPPPPALEEILKAEMELDRQSRLKIESAATERLTLEEKEIMQKEREIIESLECEERQKQLLNGTEDFNNALPTTTPSDVYEDDRILSLKNERKRIETERLMTEEQQQLNLLEEKQLREREEFIRKQEAGKSAGSHSDPSLSVAANASNNSKPAISSLTETKPKVSLSDTYGDGGNVTSNSSAGVSDIKNSECDGKDKAPEKPAVPPKPLKKKEAIRKERERLRQEQEALQREREEHRRKLMLEQEESMKHQKSHAPDAPVTQLGPLPPLVPPNFPPQLTTTMNATPNARESASFPSRSHHGASNGTAGNINAVEVMGPPIVRQNKLPASRKAVQNEAWGQQKMPSVRKQNHDSLTESRYNQNHWLIQEAEMRRITELKERQQRTTQLPCSQTHLAEDDVCSNPPRVPVIQPTQNPHLNYAVQDKMWNYGQSSMPLKKYPPPVVKDPLHTVYPREAVSQQPPTKPSRVVPMERQEQMLSVSGRKRCSHCNEELGRGAAMIIESLQLYYHIHCFQCCVCQAQLGNGSCGTDVRVRNNKLHCHNCYSNDEAGLKFSQV